MSRAARCGWGRRAAASIVDNPPPDGADARRRAGRYRRAADPGPEAGRPIAARVRRDARLRPRRPHGDGVRRRCRRCDGWNWPAQCPGRSPGGHLSAGRGNRPPAPGDDRRRRPGRRRTRSSRCTSIPRGRAGDDRRSHRRVHRQLRRAAHHGARPRRPRAPGRTNRHDPIAAAAELISTLYQFVPRATDSQDAVVCRFGQIHGGAECERDSRAGRARRHGAHARRGRARENDRAHSHAGRRHRASHRHEDRRRFRGEHPVGLQ